EPLDPLSRKYLVIHHRNLAFEFTMQNRFDKAEVHYRQAVDLQEELADDFPRVPEYRSILAKFVHGLGGVLQMLGRWEEAAAQYRKAQALWEKLVAGFPKVAQYRRDLAGSLHNLAVVLRQPSQRTEALDLFERALHQERKALELDPEDDLARQYLQE